VPVVLHTTPAAGKQNHQGDQCDLW
jgi:hypothetical protein